MLLALVALLVQDPPAGHSVHGEAFNEGPRQRARFMEGMGKVEFPVTSGSEEARRFVAQGVAQLHGFYYFEAERSFRQAAALDPALAMAYWGMAMANVNNEKRAKAFVEKAEALKAGAGRRETLWIEGLAKYYREADKAKRGRAFIRAIEGIVHEFPDDVEARAFLAWAIWHHRDKLPISSHEAVDSILAEVFRREPRHAGAHHYRIHLWDEEKKERAAASAELYGPSSPGIAHAWHMPGHIYSKMHRYADAARQQECSARVDHAAMRADRVMPYQIHNYAHNNQWLVTDLSHVGRVGDAVALAENLIRVPRHPKLNKVEDGSSCARYGRARLMDVLVRWELWDELLARAELLEPVAAADDRVQRLRALGAAHFARGDVLAGRRCLGELQGMSSDAKAKGAKGLSGAIGELEGRRLLAEQDPAAAAEALAKADGAPKDLLARAYLEAGRREEADKASQAALDAAKHQVYPLARRVEVLAELGKKEAAEAALRELRELAREADADLPVLRRIGLEFPDRKPAPKLDAHGPFLWTPHAAATWTLTDEAGHPARPDPAPGRATLVIFYLGVKCPHCVAQLNAFTAKEGEFHKLGIDVLAVSTESREAIKACREEKKASWPFVLLADPELEVFKRYGVYDDFEALPLHGTFLVDAPEPGALRVRWQEISFTPFMEVDFLVAECRRLLAR